MGLLDDVGEFLATPQGIGLLSAAFGGAAGARRGTPWNNAGRAGMAGLIGYSQAQERLDKSAKEVQQQKLRDLQVRKYEDELDYAGKAARESAGFNAALGNAKQFVPAATVTGTEKTRPGQTIMGMVGNVDAEIEKVMADPQIPNTDKMGIIAQIKKQAEVGGKNELNPLALIGSGNQRAADLGKALQTQQFKQSEAVQRSQERRDESSQRAQERMERDRLLASIGKQQTPYFSPFDSSEGAMIFDHRTGKMVPAVDAAGKPIRKSVSDPTLQGEIAGAKKAGQAKAERAINMAGLGDAITQAEELLSGTSGKALPTGSGVGTFVDAAAGLIGVSPEGAAEAQTLKAIGGALTSKMPRMEGPQSDKDTILYREMAAVVGDSTVPRDRRLAALQKVKELWGKYEHLNTDGRKSNPSVDALLEKYNK